MIQIFNSTYSTFVADKKVSSATKSNDVPDHNQISGPLFNKRTDVSGTARSHKALKPRHLGWDTSNRSEIWLISRQQHCRDTSQISERYDHYNIRSRGFETSRNLAVRRLVVWWIEAQVRVVWEQYQLLCWLFINKNICIPHPSSILKRCMLLNVTPRKDKSTHVTHSQYHRCWCHGDAWSGSFQRKKICQSIIWHIVHKIESKWAPFNTFK